MFIVHPPTPSTPQSSEIPSWCLCLWMRAVMDPRLGVITSMNPQYRCGRWTVRHPFALLGACLPLCSQVLPSPVMTFSEGSPLTSFLLNTDVSSQPAPYSVLWWHLILLHHIFLELFHSLRALLLLALQLPLRWAFSAFFSGSTALHWK